MDTRERSRIRLNVNGYSFVVHSSGPQDGSVFLILHGIGLSHRPYKKLAAQLARFGRVMVLDLPGFGSTGAPRETLTVEEYGRLIALVLARLEVRSVVAIGHSMGAQFALELALQEPDTVSHLVMIGPVVDSRRRTALRQSLALARDSVLEPITTNTIVFTDYLRAGPRWYLHEVAAMLAYPTLEKTRCLALPLLVIRGAHDPIARDSWARMLTEAAGGGAQVTIPRKRHVVVHTAPKKVARAIITFALRPSSTRH